MTHSTPPTHTHTPRVSCAGGCMFCSLYTVIHATDHDMGSLSDWYAQGDPALTTHYEVRDGATSPPPPSQTPLGQALGVRDQTSNARRGNERVSSLLLISTEDLWTCFGPLFLSVIIKYCLSAQQIPKAKGKSLCPNIICKLPLPPRTDLLTGRESVLYYRAATPPCLSSPFNVMPSHSCCSVWDLHISFLWGGKRG